MKTWQIVRGNYADDVDIEEAILIEQQKGWEVHSFCATFSGGPEGMTEYHVLMFHTITSEEVRASRS